MAQNLNSSISNTLKGKIWIATTALAFFVSVFGMIAYLLATFLFTDNIYAILIPFLVLTATVIVFGWWVSNEILSPIERVLLLGKALERGGTGGGLKTTGSLETDELMHTILRLSRQTQKLVNSMDEVAKGNLNVALKPADNSDRISNSFQKLLAKVSESIHAAQELERLQNRLVTFTEDVSHLTRNNLSHTIDVENEDTKEAAISINHVITQLSELVADIKSAASISLKSSSLMQKNVKQLIYQDEQQVKALKTASQTLKQVPQIVQKISVEITQSAFSANQSIEKARIGAIAAQSNLDSVAHLRKQLNESIKRIQKLNESSQEIGKTAKSVEDLAQRTNMVALNASIQAAELNEHGQGFSVVSEEVERLAKRANETNKNISKLNKSIQSEIGKVEEILESTVGETATLSKHAIETNNAICDLERYILQFLNLQNRIVAYTREQTTDTDQAFETVVSSITETAQSIGVLRQVSTSVNEITASIEGLSESVTHFTRFTNETEVPSDAVFSFSDQMPDSIDHLQTSILQ